MSSIEGIHFDIVNISDIETGNYFEKNVADVFNIERANVKPENFKFYDTTFFSVNDNSNSAESNHQSKTISEIINSDEVDIKVETTNYDNSSKCRSIISFNILLIHTYRIFNLQKQLQKFEHGIDPKTLLLTIKLDDFPSSEETEKFFELLWKVRYVFDKHVVKWRIEEDDDNDEKLLLTEINTSRSYEKNYFSRTNSAYSSSQMLQSVLYFTGGFTQQYWLTPFLYFLLENENLTAVRHLNPQKGDKILHIAAVGVNIKNYIEPNFKNIYSKNIKIINIL